MVVTHSVLKLGITGGLGNDFGSRFTAGRQPACRRLLSRPPSQQHSALAWLDIIIIKHIFIPVKFQPKHHHKTQLTAGITSVRVATALGHT